jgi:hypothetical protein
LQKPHPVCGARHWAGQGPDLGGSPSPSFGGHQTGRRSCPVGAGESGEGVSLAPKSNAGFDTYANGGRFDSITSPDTTKMASPDCGICISRGLHQRYDTEGWRRLMPRGYWEIYGGRPNGSIRRSPIDTATAYVRFVARKRVGAKRSRAAGGLTKCNDSLRAPSRPEIHLSRRSPHASAQPPIAFFPDLTMNPVTTFEGCEAVPALPAADL